MNEKVLKTSLGIATTVIVSEHFFSTFLSSPLTVETLYSKQKDKVLKYLNLSIIISLIYASLISFLLVSYVPLITALSICIIYYITYLRALKII